MNRIKKILKPAVENVPWLANTYRNVRDARWARMEPVTTPFGFKMIGNPAMQHGEFEAEEVPFFREIAAGSDIVINVGANIGYYCLHALSLKKHVIAFEPMSRNVALLLKNISLNNYEHNAEVFELALAEKPGILKMYGAGTGASLTKGWAGVSSKTFSLVPVSTLDTILQSRLAGKKVLIMIDVEGAELRLLEGAEQVLKNQPKPTWIVEIALEENQPEGRATNPDFFRTFETFLKYGYDAYGLTKHGLKKITMEELRRDPKGIKQECSSGNFVFK